MEDIKLINLNKENLCLKDIECGKTTFIIKVGRKKQYLDIEKDAIRVCLEKYDYMSKNRQSFSKYGNNLKVLYLSGRDDILSKEFFMNYDSIYENLKRYEEAKRELLNTKGVHLIKIQKY